MLSSDALNDDTTSKYVAVQLHSYLRYEKAVCRYNIAVGLSKNKLKQL